MSSKVAESLRGARRAAEGGEGELLFDLIAQVWRERRSSALTALVHDWYETNFDTLVFHLGLHVGVLDLAVMRTAPLTSAAVHGLTVLYEKKGALELLESIPGDPRVARAAALALGNATPGLSRAVAARIFIRDADDFTVSLVGASLPRLPNALRDEAERTLSQLNVADVVVWADDDRAELQRLREAMHANRREIITQLSEALRRAFPLPPRPPSARAQKERARKERFRAELGELLSSSLLDAMTVASQRPGASDEFDAALDDLNQPENPIAAKLQSNVVELFKRSRKSNDE